MTAENPWLQFNDGSPKNPFWIYKELESNMKYACCRLARAGGYLGWNVQSIRAAHIPMADINTLIERDIVNKSSLFQKAKELIENEENIEIKREMDDKGGYFMLDKKEKEFYFSFDNATEMIQNKTDDQLSEDRYFIANEGLNYYLQLLL